MRNFIVIDMLYLQICSKSNQKWKETFEANREASCLCLKLDCSESTSLNHQKVEKQEEKSREMHMGKRISKG